MTCGVIVVVIVIGGGGGEGRGAFVVMVAVKGMCNWIRRSV